MIAKVPAIVGAFRFLPPLINCIFAPHYAVLI